MKENDKFSKFSLHGVIQLDLRDGVAFQRRRFPKYVCDVSREAISSPTFSSDRHKFLFFRLQL